MPHPKLFGTDGIRGKAGLWPLTPDFVLKLGLVTGQILVERDTGSRVIIGRDTRQSGPMLQSALSTGLLASGISVIDVGVMTTPGVAFLARQLDAAAGVVISASHNPVHDNGIKLFGKNGLKIPADVEFEIEQRSQSEQEESIAQNLGRLIDGNSMQELYIESLVSEQRDLRLDDLDIVLDCANGAASWLAPECFARLGARLVTIHASPTGLNINDSSGAEHVRRFPQELGRLVKESGAHFGLAFDGDADRVVFVDKQSGIVDGDHMLGILARHFDQKEQLIARSFVTTKMRNEGLRNFALAHELEVVDDIKVGDKYVVEKLMSLREQSPKPGAWALGGEQAGHIIIMDDNHMTGDGIRTALFVIRALLEAKTQSLADLASIVKKTPQVIVSADVGKGDRFEEAELKDFEQESRASNRGLEINLRYSGTEDKFRAMLEGDDNMSTQELGEIASEICLKVQKKAGILDGSIEILDCKQGGLLAVQRA